MRALLLPVMCIVGLQIYRAFTISNYLDDKVQFAIVMMVLSIVSAIVWVLLAVSCHRVLLEDPDEPGLFDGIWFGWRQLNYLLIAILVGVPILAYAISTSAVRTALYEEFGASVPQLARVTADWAILLPAQYLSSRIALALPAAALKRPLSIAQAWVLSKGNGWRITAALLAAPAASELFYLASAPLWEIAPAAAPAVRTLTILAVGIISIGALSFSYHFLVERSDPSTRDTEEF